MSEKYLIWHIEGGLGKNIAATSLISSLKEKYKERKLIIVCSYPKVFLNNPFIDKVYEIGNHPYFYENYILNKDTLIFRQEPYYQTGHILKQKHLIENWCNILDIKYNNQHPSLYLNYSQNKSSNKWFRNKPILLLQTTGGPISLPIRGESITTSEYEWCRDLPIELAQSIVQKYSTKYHIIQITKQNGYFLDGVERLSQNLSFSELIGLVRASSQRILIDSSIQHITSSLKLPSIVFWIGTSPKIFGYDIHKNIIANPIKVNNQLINSYIFDYEFGLNNEECPYPNIDSMFNIPQILKNLSKII